MGPTRARPVRTSGSSIQGDLSGNGLLTAITLGRIAGAKAAALVQG